MKKTTDFSQLAKNTMAELENSVDPETRRKLIKYLGYLDGKLFNEDRSGHPVRQEIEDCFDLLLATGSAEDKAAVAVIHPD